MSSTFLHFLYHNDPVIAIKKTREYLHDQFHNPTRTRQQFSDEMKEIMGRLFGARSWLYESRYNSELYLHLKMLLKPDSFLTLLHEWNQRCGLFEFSRSQLPVRIVYFHGGCCVCMRIKQSKAPCVKNFLLTIFFCVACDNERMYLCE